MCYTCVNNVFAVEVKIEKPPERIVIRTIYQAWRKFDLYVDKQGWTDTLDFVCRSVRPSTRR